VCEYWWNDAGREKIEYLEKTSPIAALSKTIFSRIYLDLNPRIRGARTFNFPLIVASFFLRWTENGKSKILQIHSTLLPIWTTEKFKHWGGVCVRHLTNQLTPWSRVFFEKVTSSRLVKKFSAFYGTRRFITAFVRTRHMYLYAISILISNLYVVTVEKFIFLVLYIFLFGRLRCSMLLFNSEVINAIETSSLCHAKQIIILVINIFYEHSWCLEKHY
jgi:hypothetical protein